MNYSVITAEATVARERPDSGAVKHVFICGLHRSGTTILAQQIGQLKNCTGFGSTGAGLFLDEGQYLQDVYPADVKYGGVGRFGFSPESHLTEKSPLLTPGNVSRLRQSWDKYWDRDKNIRVEKTPGNLLKTRFLQAAFPNSYFIVIKRHPVAVSLATQKWSRTPLHDLFEHWLRCHEIFDVDKKGLENLYELSYEDYIKDPERHLAQIADFIGAGPATSKEQTHDLYNTKYFERWNRMLQSSRLRFYYRYLISLYEGRFSDYGYTLAQTSSSVDVDIRSKSPIVHTAWPIIRSVGETYGFFWRLGRRFKNRVKGIARRFAPRALRRFLENRQTRLPGFLARLARLIEE